MALLEKTNVSTAVLKRARVARVEAATPSLQPCTMSEDELRAAMRSDLVDAFRGASRGTVDDILVTSLVVLNLDALGCDTVGTENQRQRRNLLQTTTTTQPEIDAEIVMIPTPTVVLQPAANIFIEATPALLGLGVKKFVAEPTQRTNSTLVFLGQGIAGDGSLFALTEPVQSTPVGTPPPPPPRAQGPLEALLGSTALSCVVVAGGAVVHATGGARGGKRGRVSRVF